MKLSVVIAKLVVLAAAGAMLVPGAFVAALFPQQSYRYRLTVVVDTPEGPRSGASVVEVTEERPTGLGRQRAGLLSVSGEAVAVDLGARGTLFVLLKDGSRTATFSSQAAVIASAVFPGAGSETLAERFRRYRSETLKTRLTPEQLPLMARFRDRLDPTTVEPIADHDLAAAFGDGVRLREATLETTRDPVTRGIEQHLNWLTLAKDRRNLLLKGPFWDYRDPDYQPARRLAPSDFAAGS